MKGKRLLLAKMTEVGMSRKELAEKIGIRVETFSIKLNTNGFRCSEAQVIVSVLGLSPTETFNIFFAD